MDKIFGNAYRGDPGVPHTDPDRFVNIWIGSFAFSALTWFNPYMWQLSNAYNWHDRAMLYEQYHWKKAMKKGKKYDFLVKFIYWMRFVDWVRSDVWIKPNQPGRNLRITLYPNGPFFRLSKCSFTNTYNCHISSLESQLKD